MMICTIPNNKKRGDFIQSTGKKTSPIIPHLTLPGKSPFSGIPPRSYLEKGTAYAILEDDILPPKSKTMNEPIIVVDKLRIIYNQGKSNESRALEETSLTVYPHEYVIIFGPSGCGKSTLLYSLSGLQSATYGSVSVKGKTIAQMNEKEELELHPLLAFTPTSLQKPQENQCQNDDMHDSQQQKKRRFHTIPQGRKPPPSYRI